MAHRILVVDDDPHIRDVICYAIENAGMIAVTAQDGAEALRRLEDGAAADLVILDIGLPEMDGLELCRRIRKRDDRRSFFFPRAAKRSTASSASKSAATITSPSPSVRASWSRASPPF